jgi:hypothetical protein
MSSGVNRVVNGSVSGTGALISVRTVGFRPKKVELINIGGLVTAEWHNDMADDSMIKRVTAGDMTAPTSDGIIPLADGFSIGADADVNAAGELIHWTAYE